MLGEGLGVQSGTEKSNVKDAFHYRNESFFFFYAGHAGAFGLFLYLDF